jgi:hypothetical protein
MRLMPTSMTVAPGFTQSPFTISGRPTAATRISAVRASAARSFVREWATVTVQLAASRRLAIGLPTMLERPMTTALRPDRSLPRTRSISSMEPAGVQGTKAVSASPAPSLPTLTKVKPSTSFSGAMA